MVVNGVDYAPNTRGHNIVVINIRTKEITTAVFDTWEDSESVSNKVEYNFFLNKAVFSISKNRSGTHWRLLSGDTLAVTLSQLRGSCGP